MLRIAELATGTWHYHLHEDGGEPKFGGGSLTMLCGETFTAWDTKIPPTNWGVKADHLPEKFCAGCTEALGSQKSVLRWSCPRCEHPNPLDSVRCSECQRIFVFHTPGMER